MYPVCWPTGWEQGHRVSPWSLPPSRENPELCLLRPTSQDLQLKRPPSVSDTTGCTFCREGAEMAVTHQQLLLLAHVSESSFVFSEPAGKGGCNLALPAQPWRCPALPGGLITAPAPTSTLVRVSCCWWRISRKSSCSNHRHPSVAYFGVCVCRGRGLGSRNWMEEEAKDGLSPTRSAGGTVSVDTGLRAE